MKIVFENIECNSIPNLIDNWEFNVLDIYNYKKSGKLDPYFRFIEEKCKDVDGDICEVGVYRGNSLIATALALKELGIDKKVWGFDSFSGFPSYHGNDSLKMFEVLFNSGDITLDHYEKVKLNLEYKKVSIDGNVNSSNISTSSDFSSTSLDVLLKKINYIGLDNIVIIPGNFMDTMSSSSLIDQKFCAALIDCDLYESHKISLPFVWDRLNTGAYTFLDEYYSLKFPGSRIAINNFFKEKKEKPKMHNLSNGEFERWYTIKE